MYTIDQLANRGVHLSALEIKTILAGQEPDFYTEDHVVILKQIQALMAQHNIKVEAALEMISRGEVSSDPPRTDYTDPNHSARTLVHRTMEGTLPQLMKQMDAQERATLTILDHLTDEYARRMYHLCAQAPSAALLKCLKMIQTHQPAPVDPVQVGEDLWQKFFRTQLPSPCSISNDCPPALSGAAYQSQKSLNSATADS